MNQNPQNQILVHFPGQMSVSQENLKSILAEIISENSNNLSTPFPKLNWPQNPKNVRLAYTMKETAEILGVSYASVFRLVKRGLLRHSFALRKIIIPETEIKRFLKDTLQ